MPIRAGITAWQFFLTPKLGVVVAGFGGLAEDGSLDDDLMVIGNSVMKVSVAAWDAGPAGEAFPRFKNSSKIPLDRSSHSSHPEFPELFPPLVCLIDVERYPWPFVALFFN